MTPPPSARKRALAYEDLPVIPPGPAPMAAWLGPDRTYTITVPVGSSGVVTIKEGNGVVVWSDGHSRREVPVRRKTFGS